MDTAAVCKVPAQQFAIPKSLAASKSRLRFAQIVFNGFLEIFIYCSWFAGAGSVLEADKAPFV